MNHEGNKPFQFSNCDAKFAQNDSVVQAGYEGKRPFKCPNYALKNVTFKRHIKIFMKDKNYSILKFTIEDFTLKKLRHT